MCSYLLQQLINYLEWLHACHTYVNAEGASATCKRINKTSPPERGRGGAGDVKTMLFMSEEEKISRNNSDVMAGRGGGRWIDLEVPLRANDTLMVQSRSRLLCVLCCS